MRPFLDGLLRRSRRLHSKREAREAQLPSGGCDSSGAAGSETCATPIYTSSRFHLQPPEAQGCWHREGRAAALLLSLHGARRQQKPTAPPVPASDPLRGDKAAAAGPDSWGRAWSGYGWSRPSSAWPVRGARPRQRPPAPLPPPGAAAPARAARWRQRIRNGRERRGRARTGDPRLMIVVVGLHIFFFFKFSCWAVLGEKILPAPPALPPGSRPLPRRRPAGPRRAPRSRWRSEATPHRRTIIIVVIKHPGGSARARGRHLSRCSCTESDSSYGGMLRADETLRRSRKPRLGCPWHPQRGSVIPAPGLRSSF